MATASSTQARHTVIGRTPAGSRPGRRALAVAGGALAGLITWAVEVPLLGLSLGFQFGHAHVQTVGLVNVIGASVLAGVLGWAALALLERQSARPRAAWTGAGLAVTVVSLALPLVAATSAAAAAGLCVMHVVVAATLLPLLGRSSEAR